MFHTPPTKDSWSSHDALENSYTTATTETTKTTVTASNNINNPTVKSKLSEVSTTLSEQTVSPFEDTHIDDISSTSTDSNTSNPDDSTSTITKDSIDETPNTNNNNKNDQIQKLKIDDQKSQFLQPIPKQVIEKANDKTKASPAIKATDSNDDLNDNINEQLLTILNQEESLDDKDDNLPEELNSLLEHFYRYLKEPRFATPPSTLQISELFQKFYLKCYEKNVEYVRNNFTTSNENNDNSNNLIALLTPQEIEEERKLNHLKQSLIYKYNLIIEKKSCDKFYNSIVYPQKDIPNDQFEQLIDTQFNEKLFYLSRLLINFNTLDIDINCEEEFFVVKLEEIILPQFELMLVERSPTLKLKILDKIHELYSDLQLQ
ncbi:unnamed protein product [[Candida] boidinii]|uniref:Unnamed protein product n=1 Tax=Candida boidinii TaxID=5477 RepID=A0ACB5U1S0_CANBO|nr:unnamed protein product [[Candida] boidinii]